MQLRLDFELNNTVIHSNGEAVIDLALSANHGQAAVKVTNVKINSDSAMLDVATRVLAPPLREILAKQISQALNQAIADLPNQVSVLKKVEIKDMSG